MTDRHPSPRRLGAQVALAAMSCLVTAWAGCAEPLEESRLQIEDQRDAGQGDPNLPSDDLGTDNGGDAQTDAPDAATDLTPEDLHEDAPPEDAPPEDAAPDVTPEPDVAPEPDVTPEPDVAPEPDTPPDPVELVTCASEADDGPDGYREVNTWRGSVREVSFTLPNLPDPASITEARLHYTAYDADNPGNEGWIVLNGGGRISMLAERANENQSRPFVVDVTGRTVAGNNRVTFTAVDAPEVSYYRISGVRLEVAGPNLVCPEAPQGGTGQGVERVQGYREGTYERRRNWVLDCRDYAYTGNGDDHRACDDQYNPDGSSAGRATFTFRDVIADRYEVWLEGRTTSNRNPRGALVIVNGVERRISQVGDGGYEWGLHGTHDLQGEVIVILDSTREAESDSVRRVRLDARSVSRWRL